MEAESETMRMAGLLYETVQPYQNLLGACLATTVALNSRTVPYLQRLSLGKSDTQLKHIAADFALTPIRMILIYLSFPIFLQTLFPEMAWTSDHSSMIISAWVLLSMGYIWETIATRESSVTSLVHHGVALAFTAYCAYASQDTTGKHVILLRYTAFELFFAIGFGGMITTSNRLIYLSISREDNQVSPIKRHAVSALTWALVAIISTGWASKAAYLHHYSVDLYHNFGPLLSAILLGANILIFGIQYKWIFLWGAKADRLSRRCGKPKNINAILRNLPLRSLFGCLTLGLSDLGRIWVKLLLSSGSLPIRVL